MPKLWRVGPLVGVSLGLTLAFSVQDAACEPKPAVGSLQTNPAEAAQEGKKEQDDRIFAVVGGEKIRAQTFFDTFQAAVTRKFFHGKVPAGEIAKFQREIGRKLIEEHLLVQEAKKRGLKPDRKKIDDTVARVDAQYSKNPQWQENKAMMLRPLVVELERKDLIGQLEAKARAVPEPPEAKIRAYYDQNPKKFTEPMENKVSAILLRVDPSAGGAAWEETQSKAEALVKRIRAGEDFSSLAKEFSGDKSSAKGGKMGYLHRGMLAPVAEEAIDKLAVGEITDPIMVLEGMGIFRLDDRIEAEVTPYEKARKRAAELLKREQGETAWNALKEKLWKQGSVKIHEELYLPLQQEETPAGAASQSSGSGGAVSGAALPATGGK